MFHVVRSVDIEVTRESPDTHGLHSKTQPSQFSSCVLVCYAPLISHPSDYE